MSYLVIGLIALKDSAAFEQYRRQVGQTVAQFGGRVRARGQRDEAFWDELDCPSFDAFVELEFPTAQDAQRWAKSPEYGKLLAIRSKAMKLTLVGVAQ